MVSLPPTIAPVTIYPGPGARHANLPKADLEIVQRLQQLRGSGESVPTEDEMAERLAKLKGLPSDHYTRPSAPVRTTDTRTDQQKADDLIAQAMEEARLDALRPSTDDDLSRRLAELRGDPVPAPNWSGKQQQPPPLESPGVPQGLDDIQEVAKLLSEASGSASAEASSALAALHADPQLQATIAQSVKDKRSAGARKAKGVPRKPQRASYSSTSSTDEQERNSNTSDEDVRRKVTKVKRMGKSSEKTGDGVEKLTREDEEEVSRIVDMYSQRAARKKNKKLTKKKGELASTTAKKNKCEAKDSDTDSSSELSESDLEKLHSEKLSDSSD